MCLLCPPTRLPSQSKRVAPVRSTTSSVLAWALFSFLSFRCGAATTRDGRIVSMDSEESGELHHPVTDASPTASALDDVSIQAKQEDEVGGAAAGRVGSGGLSPEGGRAIGKTREQTPSPTVMGNAVAKHFKQRSNASRVGIPGIDPFSTADNPFRSDDAGENKSGPSNFSTPTGIHPLSSYPGLQHPLGDAAGSTQLDVAKNLEGSFALPEHQSPALDGPVAEANPENVDAGYNDTTGMTASSETFARGLPTTGHVSNNAAASQAMITQGTALSSARAMMPAERAMSLNSDASMDDQGEAIVTCRVDTSKLEVLENPLSKSDRYTVIKGRLPDSDPFMKAAQNLGLVFMSNEMKAAFGDLTGTEVSEDDRQAYFMRDIEAFNRELSRDYKIPIIGGGQLSLYALAKEVMKLGGLKNVVLNRAFRIVGQQLELPKSCTSAAFVLKNAYERLVYLYEQKLAFGINPTNPQRTIDMKSVVSETKRRGEDKRNRNSSHRRTSKYAYPVNDTHGRIVKKVTLQAATMKQMEAIREAASKELQLADPEGEILRRGAEEYPDVLAYQSLSMERLTPQQPEPGSSAFASVGFPETNAVPLQDWSANAANALFDAPALVDILGQQTNSRGEGELDPFQIDNTVALHPPPAALRGVFNFDELFSMGRVRVSVRALQ